GVFVNEPLFELDATLSKVRLDAVQLHGQESDQYMFELRDRCCRHRSIIRRIVVGEYDTKELLHKRVAMCRGNFQGEPWSEAHYDHCMDAAFTDATLLLDPGAGSGRSFRWELAEGIPGPIIVSGGLTPDNVRQAIRTLRPFAVDVSSGVESSLGFKDAAKMKAFVDNVREADADDLTR